MNRILIFLMISLMATTCHRINNKPNPEDPEEVELDGTYTPVSIHRSVDAVQPSTGLVLWSDNARSRNAKYGETITLEYAYCLPCKVVKGKKNDKIQYDWSSFDSWLNSVASRNHQAVVRFRYEYPGSRDVDGQPGTTAVPDYIKALEDYNETYYDNPEDGPTWYADWSNAELQWFTKQFYTDFNEVYKKDQRIAFVEVGFGHWSEYHIYATPLKPGQNFPTAEYQAEFLTHLNTALEIPWLISIDAAEKSPIVDNSSLMALTFGMFDDSFMHKSHEKGYNEECWNALGKGTRWQTGACGGEISYYTDNDQRNFLNPEGMYGVTWEKAASKYHITFMIANDAPGSKYGTADRFKEAGMVCGYNFKLTGLYVNGSGTAVKVTNTGIAPIYRDAYVAVGGVRGETSLKGLLPGKERLVFVKKITDGTDVTIVSDYILPTQTIQFDADL
ncbi:MAG: DUF4832 domain-containing protein [Bacteroidales bacterium]|nr:DUF4832 domain-containing protein [Bacteroidales bacterium]